MFNKIDIALRIDAELKKRRISAVKFAADMGGDSRGYNKDTVYTWRNNRSTSYMNDLQDIADYLRVEVDYLLTGKEPHLRVIKNSEEDYNMGNRRIEFSIVQDGLKAFLGRYVDENRKIKQEDCEKLSKDSGVAMDKIKTFKKCAFDINKDYAEKENLYPRRAEFNDLMRVDKCELPEAIRLQEALNEEFEYLKMCSEERYVYEGINPQLIKAVKEIIDEELKAKGVSGNA